MHKYPPNYTHFQASPTPSGEIENLTRINAKLIFC